MALTITGVRTDMAAAITAGCGLRMSAYESDNVNTPIGIVSLLEFDPRLVFSKAKAEYPFRVRVYAGSPSERANQVLLDGYRELDGSGSLTAAVEDLTNWSEAIDYASVVSVGELREQLVADQLCMVCDWEVEVVF